MGEYISREAALSEACHGCSIDFSCEPCEPQDCEIKAKLEAIPAADVVEVVRCRDCEWWGHAGCAISIVDDTDKPGENDFCSFGERKDGGQDDV